MVVCAIIIIFYFTVSQITEVMYTNTLIINQLLDISYTLKYQYQISQPVVPDVVFKCTCKCVHV